MKQMLTLEEWAAEKYRSSPPAMKQGRKRRVREDAELVGELAKPNTRKTDSPILQRILADGSSTT